MWYLVHIQRLSLSLVKMDDANDLFDTKNVLDFYISCVLENLRLCKYYLTYAMFLVIEVTHLYLRE